VVQQHVNLKYTRKTHMISLDIQTSYNLGQAGVDFSWTMDASTTVSNKNDKHETPDISEDKGGD